MWGRPWKECAGKAWEGGCVRGEGLGRRVCGEGLGGFRLLSDANIPVIAFNYAIIHSFASALLLCSGVVYHSLLSALQ